MTENRGPGVGALIFGVGLIFGGLMVYIVMKRLHEPSLSLSQSLPPPATPPPQLRLEPQVLPNLQYEQERTYKNNEKWQIERGPDGRIKSLNVIRDAKVN